MSDIDGIALEVVKAIGNIDPEKLPGGRTQAIAQAQILVRDAIERQIEQAEARVAELEPDAMRYRFLRSQHWSDGALCVVKDPKRFVRLGAYCPSGEYLDSVIDEAERAGGEQ